MSLWKSALTILAVLAGASSRAAADEVATIVNDTDTNIELYLKWSTVANESAKIVLDDATLSDEYRPLVEFLRKRAQYVR